MSPPPPSSNPIRTISAKWRTAILSATAFGLVLSIVIAVVSAEPDSMLGRWINNIFPQPTPTLPWSIDLADNESVDQMTTVSVQHPVEIDGDIWIVLQRQQLDNQLYYPVVMAADPPCEPKLSPQDGTLLRQEIRIGDDDDYDKAFKLYILVANTDASRIFQDRWRDWCQKNNYEGIAELPQSIEVKLEVLVQRESKRQ